MTFRILCRAVVSGMALFLLQPLVQACADGGDPYDYYPSFFDNRLAGKDHSDFLQFRYSALTNRFYDDWGWNVDSSTIPTTADTADGNRAEWGAYTGGLPAADIDSFVYSYPRASLSALYYNLEKGTPAGGTETYEGNAMTTWFRQSKDLEALGYLMWAKQVEEATRKPNEYYSWEPTDLLDTVQLRKLQKGGGQLMAAAKIPFIKQRYGYQILKMLFQTENYEAVLRRYDSLSAGATGNIAARNLGLKAGAHFRLGQKVQAAYLYSRLFDRGPEWRRTAYTSYDWADGSKQQAAVLKRCTSPHERAVVYLMNGLREFEYALPQIKAAAAEDPLVDGLEAVFTREINKTEERFLEEKLTASLEANKGFGYDPYWGSSVSTTEQLRKQHSYESYVSEMAAFGTAQVARVPAAQQGYWHLAVAYLGYLQGNNGLLQSQLALAGKVPLSPFEQEQRSMLQLLQIAKLNAPVTPETEAQMLPYLVQLDSRRKVSPVADKMYRDFTGAFLAGKYLSQKDSVKAVFALARVARGWSEERGGGYFVSDDYTDNPGVLLQQLSPAGFEALKSFSAGKAGTAYDRWLVSASNPYPVGSLYEIEGTRKMRYYQFAEAVDLYAKGSPAEMKKRIFPDPFLFDEGPFVNDYVVDTAAAITRQDFARKMASLQGKTDAQSLFEYGLGLYGMSYYGPAHRAYDYYRSSVDDLGYYESADHKNLSQPEREYYGVYAAEAVFVKAAAAATDKELKAKAVFMAAKCWQKRTPSVKRRNHYEENGDYYRYSLKSPYFKTLKAELSGTETYKNLLSSCDFLKDYAKKR